jgi:transcription initiation factor TFIIIB Brf1 subunit/transcription initiation factor TFIIB
MSDVECAFCGVPVMKFEFKSGPEWHHFVPPETYRYCRFGPTSTRSSVATPVTTNRT